MASRHPPPPPQKPLLVGISGCSSSGKTTITRLLRDIFAPHIIIIHQDDFYKPEAEIPLKPNTTLQDWDCPQAFDIPALISALEHIKGHGTLPLSLSSKEDQNLSKPPPGITPNLISSFRDCVQHSLVSINLPNGPPHIFLLDGILLYPPSVDPISSMLDLKLFLPVRYDDAKSRRESRSGYVTLEGFWEDPPGYFDAIVWPNYVQEHKSLFCDGDVEGELRKEWQITQDIKSSPKVGRERMMLGAILEEFTTEILVALSHRRGR